MRIEHVKFNEKKVVISLSDFRRGLDCLKRNYKIHIKCNWDNICHNDFIYFEIDVTDKNYHEHYIVTNPDFYFILSLAKRCDVNNISIELKGSINQEFRDSIFKTIDKLNDSISIDFKIEIINNYIGYKIKLDDVKKTVGCIAGVVKGFIDYDIQLSNNIYGELHRLERRINEIYNVIKIIDYSYSLVEETCFKKNVKDRDNEKIDISISQIKGWSESLSNQRFYE